MAPWKCPVCGGRGMVDAMFYDALDLRSIDHAFSTPSEPLSCRSCQGTGIVWDPPAAGYVPGTWAMPTTTAPPNTTFRVTVAGQDAPAEGSDG